MRAECKCRFPHALHFLRWYFGQGTPGAEHDRNERRHGAADNGITGLVQAGFRPRSRVNGGHVSRLVLLGAGLATLALFQPALAPSEYAVQWTPRSVHP